MRINLKLLKILTIVTIILIIINQGIWIYNMYDVSKQELEQSIDVALDNAIHAEIVNRMAANDIPMYYSVAPTPNDTNRYMESVIRTKDTTFLVKIDKSDPTMINKALQFMVKDISPVNVNHIDSIFKQSLQDKYDIQETYIEYIDLQKNTVIDQSKSKSIGMSLYASKIIPIDIIDTIGIKGYVSSPLLLILGRMLYQLILSVILIIIAIACLSYQIKTIFHQKKIEKMRRDFISAMTHEFNRPISSAVAMIDVTTHYLGKSNIPMVKKNISGSLLELNKLSAYIEKIRQISKDENGIVQINKSEIEIHNFFEEIKNKYISSEKYKGKEINIELNITTQKTHINADLLHLSNVMYNLIENAIKYSDNPVSIVVTVNDENFNSTKISVKDNGFGMSKTDKMHIFETFYRSPSKKIQSQSGFGLGMSYVKSIVNAHKGKINIVSEIGEGSEFIIILPE